MNNFSLADKLKKDNNLAWLIYFYVFLVIGKTLLSLSFTTPWIFADEAVYAGIAKNMYLNLNFLSSAPISHTYPPGYSFLLLFSYIFADNNIYHAMLFINALINSLILFPAYYISKKFMDNKFALIIAILIAIAPSNVLYTFALMSENLFIPLFLFSTYFVINTFTTDSKVAQLLAGFSVTYLFITRSTGIAIIVSFCVVFVYYIWINKELINSIRQKSISLVSLFGSLFIWIHLKTAFTQEVQSLDKLTGYSVNSYVQTLMGAVTSFESFILFIKLTIHEIDYLIVASFFIFFVFAIFAILHKDYIKNKEVFNIFTLYTGVSAFILLIITVTHMYSHFSNGNQYYSIFGRYIDPILPIIYIIGGIGISIYTNYKCNRKSIYKLGTIIILLFAIVAFSFPISYYKFPNMLTIFYIVKYSIPIVSIILTVSIFFLIYHIKRSAYILLLFIILASLIAIVPAYQQELKVSLNTENENQIGRWLQENDNYNSTTLMDREDFNNYWGPQMWFLTKFWMNGNLIRAWDVTNISENVDYVISSKLLPYEPIISSQKYTLYDTHFSPNVDEVYTKLKNNSYRIDIGNNDASYVNNFWNSEHDKIRWTKNISKIEILYPKDAGKIRLIIAAGGHRPPDSPASVKLYLNDKYITNFSKESGYAEFMVNISQDYLNSEYQILTIETNTWNPSDYGSKDGRDLGIQVDWIKIENYRAVDGAN